MKRVVLLFTLFFVVMIVFSQETKTIVFQQGFEDVEYFSKLSPSGYTSSQDPENGYWGVFKENKAVCVSDDQAAMGNYSLKVTRMVASQNQHALCVFSPTLPLSGVSTIEVWTYRPSDSEFAMYFMGFDKNNESNKRVNVAMLNTGEKGKFFIRNNDENNLRTYVPMPADIWVLMSVEFNYNTNKIIYSYESDGKKTIIGELDLIKKSIEIDCIMFGAAPSPVGSATYFDDITIYHSN